MIEAEAVRRFNDAGRDYAPGDQLLLAKAVFAEFRTLGLVRRARPQRAPRASAEA